MSMVGRPPCVAFPLDTLLTSLSRLSLTPLSLLHQVGYVLGLGDRHPSNLMLDRKSGKVLHIDFGDCFEVAMQREKFPERVPFRLTRMLVSAMEVSGIEGNYRLTCERVMRVLRENNDSLVATLEVHRSPTSLSHPLLSPTSNLSPTSLPPLRHSPTSQLSPTSLPPFDTRPPLSFTSRPRISLTLLLPHLAPSLVGVCIRPTHLVAAAEHQPPEGPKRARGPRGGERFCASQGGQRGLGQGGRGGQGRRRRRRGVCAAGDGGRRAGLPRPAGRRRRRRGAGSVAARDPPQQRTLRSRRGGRVRS